MDDTAAGAYFDEENAMVGPFTDPISNKDSIWVHLTCAIWSPRVYHDSKNRLINVGPEVARSRGLKCTVCNKNGASIGCSEPRCGYTFHFRCALQTGCFMAKDFRVMCPDHFYDKYVEEEAKQVDQVPFKASSNI